jgi:hypothetical protein
LDEVCVLKTTKMKTISFLLVIAIICVFPAQGQQPFSSVTLGSVQNHEVVSFSIPRETNVKYYRVEASNDSVNYEIIGTVRSTGNSVLAKTYHYELYQTAYKYYRIGMVGMNAGLQYSSIITTQKQGIQVTPPTDPNVFAPGPAIVTNIRK